MASSNIKVAMPGKGEITLKPTDHLATGGEGAVYLKNNMIFKIFLNPHRAQTSGMGDKIRLLSQIKHPFIVAPIDVLLDVNHQLVGYYMAQAEGIALMKTFSNGWRDLNSFTESQSIQLVENMREAVLAAHALKAVMVDANETNYLAFGTEPRIIDVDSWQIGSHAATAIMPSIRDYHSTSHNENTDWFAWGVVSFQVFTGIHPYKGTHPGFKKADLEGRMRANASVFDRDVRLNTAVRDFSCIPKPLLEWYDGVFTKGERSAPPSALLSQAPVKLAKKTRIRQTKTGSVRHDRVHGFAGQIGHVSNNFVAFFADAKGNKAFDLLRQQAIPSIGAKEIDLLFSNQAALVRHGESFVLITCQGESLQGLITPGERDPMPVQAMTNLLPLSVKKLVVMGNRVFALNTQSDNGMIELELTTMGSKLALTVKTAWPINVQSTQFFDGFGVMDCLGVPFIVLPELSAMTIQRAAGLAEFKLINGFARNSQCVWVHGVRRSDGQIYRIELQTNGKNFEISHMEVVDEPELNIAVTSKGIAVAIFDDGVVTVRNTAGTSSKEVADATINKEMHLFAMPDGVFYYEGQDVFKITLS